QEIADLAARLAKDTSTLNQPHAATWVDRVHAFSTDCWHHLPGRSHYKRSRPKRTAPSIQRFHESGPLDRRPDGGTPSASKAASCATDVANPANSPRSTDTQPDSQRPFLIGRAG
ncbi:MAG TPA: hypothetical protein VNR40_15260, partial [Steroidobacter sp.]|nr:hypothetical protein [Steroidobacter sp.]